MKNRRRFNSKGRQIVKTEIDNTETSKIKFFLLNDKEKYDECNQLLLPSKKRPTKKLPELIQRSSRILSKTQRKKLEKIVYKKKKKVERSSLLEALAQVQASEEEIKQLTSVASMQTKGLKRHFRSSEDDSNIFTDVNFDSKKVKINSISGSKRRKKILAAVLSKNCKVLINDPNIVGQDDSEYSSDGSDQKDIVDNSKSTKELCSKNLKENQDNLETISSIPSISNVKSGNQEEGVTNQKEMLESKILIKNSSNNRNVEKVPAVFIPVNRDTAIQKERLKLPILAEEQLIMEAVAENDVVVIAGETGSGKTTQVPQFLYEAGFAKDCKMIGVTQPRRVAAISMSKRVAQEMNLTEEEISYLIRFEGNVTQNTKIKFMTDGVLLKEIQTDFTLSKYSVIILDEAHERSVYTDILIGLLSRIVPLRRKHKNPLKLIIMSATLRVEDFTENSRLFKIPPPVLKVDARQYPVTVYFNKKTSNDYVKECFLKTCKIHKKLPEGGILIFVTGQQEVNILVRKLRKTFPMNMENSEFNSEENSKKTVKKNRKLNKKQMNVSQFEINLDKYFLVPQDDTELDIAEEEDLDTSVEDFEYVILKKELTQQPLWVLPMYSLLPSSEQAKVFAKPPEGCRLCVVSTNVAETSLTIPNIKYVVDSGKTKTKLYDKTTGVTNFHISWCSKASADQRAGRAGRVGPGYCYRLYSSAVYNDEFPLFSAPEIQQKPVDDLILQMKSMNIVKVFNFPFPTSPDLLQLKSGEKRLKILGALENKEGKDEWSSKLTKLGETMACFPVSPRFAKMLALSYQHNLLQYTVCIVAALSVADVLLNDQEENKWSQLYRNWAGSSNSLLLGDVMVLLRAVGAAEYSRTNLEEFCLKHGLRYKAVIEIKKIRAQLTNQINLNLPGLNLSVEPNMKPPTDVQAKLLRQILLSGLGDHVAHKFDLAEIKEPKEKVKWKRAYRHSEIEEPIFMHSSSLLKKHLPEWVVYQEIYETNKLYMRGLTAIEPEWLPVYVPSLCNLSEPLEEPPPRYDFLTGRVCCHVKGTFGKAAFNLPTVEIPFTNTLLSFKWFAKFLLEGEVFPKLKRFKESLLSSPNVMTKTWAKLHPRTEKLLTALVSKEANTRDQIIFVWKDDPFYLLEAYKSWLPESSHEILTLMWPPL